MAEEDPTQSLCKECRNPIPYRARLCSHCNSYQDWRGLFSISTITLALMTALISVIGAVSPAVINMLYPPRSKASLQMPSLDGTTLRVVAINKGGAPASLIRARIDGDYLAAATKVRLRNDGDAIIPPGSKLLTFDVIPLLNEDQSYQGSLDALGAIVSKKHLPQTSVIFGLAHSDGSISVHKFPLSDNDMFNLLRENADRCSNISEPNFINGCIGAPEEAPKEESDTTPP